ncbi:MAG: 50S ribosomal protein L11 methyltransferase [Deltaproteobacteria bacterium]|nr:50S ribosomal protein L11 methyltransferase [Deltaproteobacteria bacterium]
MKKHLSWIEISLTVSPELNESCSSIIFEETGQGSFTTEMVGPDQASSPIKAYLPKDESFRENLLKIKKRIDALYTYFPDFPPPCWDLRLIFEENWQENWKRFFKPLRVCSRIIVCPTWEDYEKQPDETVLRLDPGQAFGTGGHTSTRLCLKAIESLAEDPLQRDFLFSRVLDAGTGSGILALAAASFGAGSVLAIDNDPLAVEATKAHVSLNGLTAIIQVESATPEEITGPFSLILANLTLNELIPLAQTFKQLLSPKGVLVTSGILDSQARSLISSFVKNKLAFLGSHFEEEWACILFQARP